MTAIRHARIVDALAVERFPRIDPDEEVLIREWLTRCACMDVRVSIDVPVGPGAGFAEASSGVVDRMWNAITRRRADVVLFHGKYATVVEAKRHAPIATVTQILRYADDYRNEHPELDGVFPMVLCRSFVAGLECLLVSNGGALLKLPADRGRIESYTSSFFQEVAHG